MTAFRIFLLELVVGVTLATPLAYAAHDELAPMTLAEWALYVVTISATLAVLITVTSQRIQESRQVRRG